MKYFISLASLAVIYLLVSGIVAAMRCSRSDGSGRVILPKASLIIGIIGAGGFAVPTLLSLYFTQTFEAWHTPVFAAFALLGASLIVAYFNCRIIYGENEFTYKTFFGVERTVCYKDLTAIQGKAKDVRLYSGKLVIRVDEGATNAVEFVTHAERQYKKHHDGICIPRREKKDLFNNHVENPGEFIFIFIVMGTLLLTCTVFAGFTTVPERESEFESVTVTVDWHRVEEASLYLYGTDGNKYLIKEYTEVMTDADRFIELIGAHPELELSVLHNGSDDNPFYIVSRVDDGGAGEHLSFETWERNARKQHFTVAGILLICDLVMAIVFGSMIYVGRNADKLSDRVLHTFFRPGYIHRD